MTQKNLPWLFFGLLFSIWVLADNSLDLDVKGLKEAGVIKSLEIILDNLTTYNIERLLEVELKYENSHSSQPSYVYEIEFINNRGIVLEIEVDAMTSQVLNIKKED